MHGLIDGRVFIDPVPGGVTRVAQHLITSILQQTQTQDEFTIVTTGLRRPTLPFNASHTHVPIPNKLLALTTHAHIMRFDQLARRSFDVLFLPNLEMTGKPKLPYALLVHDLSFLIEPRWFKAKSRLWHYITHAKSLMRNADALFTVSERTKNDLQTYLHIPSERIQVLPIGATLNTDTVHPVMSSAPLPPTPYFLVLGENDPRKNVSCVTQAFKMLQQDPLYKDVHLVVTGGNFRPSDQELKELIRNSAGLLYPSWYEGFGLPLHEAAQHHIPIIASTAGALSETAPLGTLFAPPFKPHLWTQAMRSTLASPQKTQTSLQSWTKAGSIVVDTLHRIAKTT